MCLFMINQVNLPLQFDDIALPWVTNIDLGVTISDDLSFSVIVVILLTGSFNSLTILFSYALLVRKLHLPNFFRRYNFSLTLFHHF